MTGPGYGGTSVPPEPRRRAAPPQAAIVFSALYIVCNLLLSGVAVWVQRRYVGERSPLELSRVGNLDGGRNA